MSQLEHKFWTPLEASRIQTLGAKSPFSSVPSVCICTLLFIPVLAPGFRCCGPLSNSFESTPSPSCFHPNKYTESRTPHVFVDLANVPQVRKQAGQPRGNFERSLRGIVITLMFVVLGFFPVPRWKPFKETSIAPQCISDGICTNI